MLVYNAFPSPTKAMPAPGAIAHLFLVLGQAEPYPEMVASADGL